MTNRQSENRSREGARVRLVEPQAGKEAFDEVTVVGNNVARRSINSTDPHGEIDLGNDVPLQGVQVIVVVKRERVVKEIAKCIVALFLLTLIFLTTDVPREILLAMLTAIFAYYFGKLKR